MKDAPGIAAKIENTSFNQKSLTHLVLEYHDATNKATKPVVYSKMNKITGQSKWFLRFGVGVGLNFSRINAMGVYYIEAAPILILPPVSTIPTASNMPNILRKKNLKAWSVSTVPTLFLNLNNNSKNFLQLELSLQKNSYSINDFTIHVTSFVLPIIYKREFLHYKKIRPFLDVGASLHYDYLFNADNLYMEYDSPVLINNTIVYDHHRIVVGKSNTNIRDSPLHIGFLSGLGISSNITEKNCLDIELRGGITSQFFETDFGNQFNGVFKYGFLNCMLLGRISF